MQIKLNISSQFVRVAHLFFSQFFIDCHCYTFALKVPWRSFCQYLACFGFVPSAACFCGSLRQDVVHQLCECILGRRDLHRVPETRKTRPDQFCSGSGWFSGFNFFVRVGFGFKNQFFFSGKILKLV